MLLLLVDILYQLWLKLARHENFEVMIITNFLLNNLNLFMLHNEW